MKFLKNIVVCLSIIAVVTVYLVSNPVIVYADVPASQIVQSHSATWGTYQFSYTVNNVYYTVQDSTGIPSGTVSNPAYFYTDGSGKFYKAGFKQVFTTMLNRGVGVVIKDSLLDTYVNTYLTYIGILDNGNLYKQGGLYDGNNNFLGYALNDISGCYYYNAQPDVTIPSFQIDNVRNFYDYVTDVPVDYITYTCPTYQYVSDHYQNGNYSDSNFELLIHNINEFALQYDNLFSSYGYPVYQGAINNIILSSAGTVRSSYFAVNQSDYAFISTSTTNTWNTFCNQFKLVNNEHELLFSDLTSVYQDVMGDSKNISYKSIDPINGADRSAPAYVVYARTDDPYYNNANAVINFYLGLASGEIKTPFGKNITIYKDLATFKGINTDRDYEPTAFNGTGYYNYDSYDDNSFTVSINNIDNSVSNNSNAYDNSVSNFYDNVTNNTVDNSTINENVQTIINNYYPSSGDNGGGSGGDDNGGGSGSDDDINDDNVLSALLIAIRHFFHIIGQLIGTILTGIVTILNAIIEAISGIMDNFTGISDLFASLLGWLPSPIPEVLGIGVSICVLFAILHFIRG